MTLGVTDDSCVIAQSLRQRGYIQFEQGRLRESYQTYRESQKFEPNSSVAREELEALYQAMQLADYSDLPPKDFRPPPTTKRVTSCTN